MNHKIIAAITAVCLAGLGVIGATSAAFATAQECVPSAGTAAYDDPPVLVHEAYDDPQILVHEAYNDPDTTVEDVAAHWQRYSWTGGPHTSDDAPGFPSGDWQANTQSDPHGIGHAGAYFRSNGNSGNGDWFYLEWVDAVTHVVPGAHHDAVYAPGDHHDAVYTPGAHHDAIPAVTCPDQKISEWHTWVTPKWFEGLNGHVGYPAGAFPQAYVGAGQIAPTECETTYQQDRYYGTRAQIDAVIGDHVLDGPPPEDAAIVKDWKYVSTAECPPGIVQFPTPQVTDVCGPANATWVLPTGDDRISWQITEDGRLIGTIVAAKFTWPNGSLVNSWGTAPDSGTLCPVEKKVLVCKYVGTPGQDERLKEGKQPISVSENSLLGDGFDGTFPFEFSDAQGRSVAIAYDDGEEHSAAECPPHSPDVVVPNSPVVKNLCVDEQDHYGLPSGPEGITYSRDGKDIVATLGEGFSFGTLPTGWVLNEDGTATFAFDASLFTGTPRDAPCATPFPAQFAATPGAPSCDEDGSLPSLDEIREEFPNVTFSISPSFDGPGDYILTVTPKDGFTFTGESVPEGWEPNGDGSYSKTITVEGALGFQSEDPEADCYVQGPIPVTPTLSTQEECGPGGSFNFGNEAGLEYSYDGERYVTVHAVEGYVLDIDPNGLFVLNEETGVATADLEGFFSDEPCVTPCVDVNTADLETLVSLDGVNSILAQRIIDGRPYVMLHDLVNVNGIGEVSLEALLADNNICPVQTGPTEVTPVIHQYDSCGTANDGWDFGDDENVGLTVRQDGTVVTFQAMEGYVIVAGNGFVLNEDGTASFDLESWTWDDTACPTTPVTPAVHVVTPAQPRLAATGVETWQVGGLAALVLMLGVGAVAASRRKGAHVA